MAASSGLKQKIWHTLAWIVVFPSLVLWPFLSAFPAFSLLGASAFDLTASLNLVFLLTGFWPLAAIAAIALLLLRSEARGRLRATYSTNRGLTLGAYATVWTILYIIAAYGSR